MRLLFKWLLFGFLGLALIAAIFVLYLLFLFDANDFKPALKNWVAAQTELDMHLEGDLSLSFFPKLGLSAHSVQINKASEQLASLERLHLITQLKPLLRGELVVDGLLLEDLDLNVRMDAQGRSNWTLASQPGKQEAATAPSNADLARSPLAALLVGELRVHNARIHYQDEQKRQSHEISALNLQLDNPQHQNRFPLSADFNYLSATGVNLPVSLRSEISLNPQIGTAQLDDLRLNLAETGIKGNIRVQQALTVPQVVAQLQITNLNLVTWAKWLQIDIPSGLPASINAELEADYDHRQERLKINQLSATAPGLQLRAQGDIANISRTPHGQGTLELNIERLRQWLQLIQPSLVPSDKNTFGPLQARLDYRIDAQTIQLDKLKVSLDQSNTTGRVLVRLGSQPQYQIDLNLDRINLSPYLATTVRKDNPAKNSKAVPDAIEAQQVHLTAEATSGHIRFKELSGKLLTGKFLLEGGLDIGKPQPHLNLKGQLNAVQAGPLFAAFNQDYSVSGLLDLDFDAKARGSSAPEIKQTLSGQGKFVLSNGVLKDMDLEHMICEGIATLRQLPFPQSTTRDTSFNTFKGKVKADRGVVQLESFDLAIEKATARGFGSINLPKDALDISLRAKLIGTLDNKACEVHERFRAVEWPVRCQGSWLDSNKELCALDQPELQKILVRLAEEEIKRKLQEKFGGQLQNLFNRQ